MQTLSSINSVTLSTATGTLTGSGSTNVSDGDTVTIGSIVYRFKTVMAQAYDVQIGGSGNSDTSLLNLIKAINLSGSYGTNYYAGTLANPSVTAATSVTSHAFAVTAIQAGIYGQVTTTDTSAVLSWGATTLTGGTTMTIVGTVSQQTFTQPAQRSTIAEYPANPYWSRGHRVTDASYQIIRNGGNTFAALLSALSAIAATAEPSLSWPPIVATQPTAATCAGTASATGTLTGSGSTNVSDGDAVTIGTQTYRFKTVMAQAFDIQIGGSGNSDTSLLNLIAAINLTGTAGTNYFAGTTINTQVTAASSLTSHAFAVTAKVSGLAANAIATTKSSTPLSWGSATLTGGTDAAASMSVVAGVTESTVSYQWQYSNNGGTTWTNIAGTVNGTAYTGYTTATLTCTPTTTGQTGYLHQCVLKNASGSTNSNAVSLTIS
jgi:hypothetical protein